MKKIKSLKSFKGAYPKEKQPGKSWRDIFQKSNISGSVNYKNILLLRHYITVSGKIIPKRLNHLTTKRQRYITKAIKNARLMSFLPFVRLSSYS